MMNVAEILEDLKAQNEKTVEMLNRSIKIVDSLRGVLCMDSAPRVRRVSAYSLSAEQAQDVREKHATKLYTREQLTKLFGVSLSTIDKVLAGDYL